MEYMKKQRQLPFDKGASEFVPTDMQPANEWQELKETFLFDWPLLETPQVHFAKCTEWGRQGKIVREVVGAKTQGQT